MEKLIIECCVHDEGPAFPPELKLNMPKTIKEVADSVRDACNAGAAVAHVHQPLVEGGKPFEWNEKAHEEVLELTRLIRQTDIIFDHRGGRVFTKISQGEYFMGHMIGGESHFIHIGRIKRAANRFIKKPVVSLLLEIALSY